MKASNKSVLLLLYLCSSAVSTASGSKRSSSSSTYVPPKCKNYDGFYCPAEGNNYSCTPRTKRCTGNDSAPLCEQKTYQHCDYDSAKNKFKVYRFATSLFRFSSRGWHFVFDALTGKCFHYKRKHHFITYRGLTFEFGNYGTRVQDPNDPKYEYNTKTTYGKTFLGESSCTYEQVVEYMKIGRIIDCVRTTAKISPEGWAGTLPETANIQGDGV